MNERQLAFKILNKIERDNAYSNLLLVTRCAVDRRPSIKITAPRHRRGRMDEAMNHPEAFKAIVAKAKVA